MKTSEVQVMTDTDILSYLGQPGGAVPLPVGLQVAARVRRLVDQTQQLDSLCGSRQGHDQHPGRRRFFLRSKSHLPSSLPLAIMLVATSLMVDWDGPEEVMVVTRQALSESQ